MRSTRRSAFQQLPPLAVAAHATFVLRASSLDPDAEPFVASPGESGGRLHFTDSEGSLGDSDAPASSGRGKAVRQPRRHHRRRRRQPRHGGFMADARCSGAWPTTPPRRLPSIIVHLARMSVQPDTEGFQQVESRRRWRRVAAPCRLVPSNLVGKCFNCLAGDHVRANCTFPSKCFNCKDVGHQARDCPLPLICRWEGKRGRSPARTLGHSHDARRRRSSPSPGDSASARSASIGREPSIPPGCQPPTLEPQLDESAGGQPPTPEPLLDEPAGGTLAPPP